MTIRFSDTFVPIEDLTRLKAPVSVRRLQSDDSEEQEEERQAMEIKVDAVEGQEQEMVNFAWEPISFTETELNVQLNFEQPVEISV